MAISISVPGALDSKTLDEWIAKGGGNTELTSVEGGKLWVKGEGKDLWVTDEKGTTAHITIADVYQSNGVILVVDKVLMPKG